MAALSCPKLIGGDDELHKAQDLPLSPPPPLTKSQGSAAIFFSGPTSSVTRPVVLLVQNLR